LAALHARALRIQPKIQYRNSIISFRFGTLVDKALVTLNGLPNIVTAFTSTITASTCTRTASHTYTPCTYCASILTVCTSTFRSGIESGYGLAKSCGSFRIRIRNTTSPQEARDRPALSLHIFFAVYCISRPHIKNRRSVFQFSSLRRLLDITVYRRSCTIYTRDLQRSPVELIGGYCWPHGSHYCFCPVCPNSVNSTFFKVPSRSKFLPSLFIFQ
jgi:hypothetical protein